MNSEEKKPLPLSESLKSSASANSAEAPTSLAPVSTANAERYSWGDDCKAWFLLKEPKLAVIEEEMPPGTSELLHFHHKAQQLFYILQGEAIMEIDGEFLDLKPSQSIHVAPGNPHRIRNSGAKTLRFLVISEPESHGDKEIVSDC